MTIKNKRCRLAGMLLSTWRRLYKNNRKKYWKKMSLKRFTKIIDLKRANQLSIVDVMAYGRAKFKAGVSFAEGLYK